MASTTSFIFWNIRGNSKNFEKRKPHVMDSLSRLARTRQCTVLLLAECNLEPQEVIDSLAAADRPPFVNRSDPDDKVQVFSNLPPESWQLVYADDMSGRLCIYRLELETVTVLIGIIHFLDKRNYPNIVDRSLAMNTYADKIKDVEETQGLTKTVLVGDLNMNPYEVPVVSPNILNARMTKRMALAAKAPAFYNPMWDFFGDRNAGPPGTYYYNKSQGDNHWWHIVDQILVRPTLI